MLNNVLFSYFNDFVGFNKKKKKKQLILIINNKSYLYRYNIEEIIKKIRIYVI